MTRCWSFTTVARITAGSGVLRRREGDSNCLEQCRVAIPCRAWKTAPRLPLQRGRRKRKKPPNWLFLHVCVGLQVHRGGEGPGPEVVLFLVLVFLLGLVLALVVLALVGAVEGERGAEGEGNEEVAECGHALKQAEWGLS